MKARKRNRLSLKAWGLALIAVAGSISSSLSFPQEGHSLKPFRQWSKKEANSVLEESDWVIKQEVRIRYAELSRRIAGGSVPSTSEGGLTNTTSTMADMGGAEAPVDFQFTLRLRSAVVVRQALVRLKQLDANYDQMSQKDRAAFDARFKGLLECPACEQNYVLTLSSRSKQNPGADPVFTVFKGGRLSDLQRYVFIANGHGERRDLIHFVPPKAPGDEAIFYFPRFNLEGKPLLTSTETELIANFTNNDVNMNTNFQVDVTKLVVNGQIDF